MRPEIDPRVTVRVARGAPHIVEPMPTVSPSVRRQAPAVLAGLMLLLCALTLVLAYANKARCAGGELDEWGRSLVFDIRKDRDVCYSDIQFLWSGREIDNHVFPYVDGDLADDGSLIGGAVEYPVLSGVLMWVGAIGVDNDADYLWHSALLLAPFALLTAWMLARLAGWAALVWAIGPPLVLYAFHNWELPVVCTAVGAVFVMATMTRWSIRVRGIVAAVLLGLGFCLKLYPGIFVLPLALFVLTRGETASGRRDFDVRGAAQTILAAMLTVVAVNLPFAVAGFPGWRASIVFQQQRSTDVTTNSFWYWGHQLIFGPYAEFGAAWHRGVAVASPLLVLGAFGLALWLGWRRYAAGGVFPWVGVSAAMLCGFLLFHKVYSPQYTLWIIPFFVLLEVPWAMVGAYLVADAAVGVGVFRYFAALGSGHGVALWEATVQFGVWGRTALLVVLFFVFLRSGTRAPVGQRPIPKYRQSSARPPALSASP